jgi:3-deoxy-D-manno-octulosonate 8-phosphate phosphatase (KDO 8-P phosphatase)
VTINSGVPTFDSRDVKALAQGLRILLLDVDGVMTDGGIILIGGDLEAKRFDVQDGMGVTLLRSSGMMVGIVTSRDSEVVQRRAKELGMEELFQGVRHKPEVLEQLREKYGIEPSQAAFVGDDIQDVPIMRLVGVPIAVQNAIPEVKESSVYVTKAPGGHGAIREVAEWLLELRGDRELVYRQITGQEPVPQG